MLTFTSVSTIEFESEEDLEAMVRKLPLQPWEINALLDGDEITDENDESEATGAGKVVHKFKITGKEE
jgi:hypothetical protein